MVQTLLDLVDQPLVNNLCDTAEEALAAIRYPLKAVYQDDLTIHLDTEVPPDKLYEHYLYQSGVSEPYIKHCKEMYRSLYHLNLETVIDIGGNDGTLLKSFREESKESEFWCGVKPKRFINVDASESFRSINEEAGIEYCKGFFNEDMDLPKANLIVSTNVFQHTKDIHSFLRGIQKHLDGVWVLEFPYTLTTLATLQFDQFYHEHYYYWLVSPLEQLFQQYGLRIIYMQENNMHGGTMRMWMTNKEYAGSMSGVVDAYKEKEQRINFAAFNKECHEIIGDSREFIASLEGRTAFFGAAAKGVVFLNALHLTIDNMPSSYVIDDTPGKQGKYIPGAGLEIVSREALRTNPVDNIIILAHNFAPYIASSLRQEFAGKIYTCLPSIKEY